ncbi:hypothetical protein SAMN05421755_11176 [Nitrosomonas sp. Nm33]|nr:hypothetical protein SAMN05421755_11176 [Nitrosomonas sp. Nm33]
MLLAAPKVGVSLGFSQVFDFYLHFWNPILSTRNDIIALLHAILHV